MLLLNYFEDIDEIKLVLLQQETLISLWQKTSAFSYDKTQLLRRFWLEELQTSRQDHQSSHLPFKAGIIYPLLYVI